MFFLYLYRYRVITTILVADRIIMFHLLTANIYIPKTDKAIAANTTSPNSLTM